MLLSGFTKFFSFIPIYGVYGKNYKGNCEFKCTKMFKVKNGPCWFYK